MVVMLIINDRELLIRELAKAFPLIWYDEICETCTSKLPALSIIEKTLLDDRTGYQVGINKVNSWDTDDWGPRTYIK